MRVQIMTKWLAVLLVVVGVSMGSAEERRLLYVAAPGIRNYEEYGGHGLLVFDIDDDHKFVKRIATGGLNGDELFSVTALYDLGKWFVYYIPNGTSESGFLGVAFGNEYDALDRSSMVTSDSKPISVWGTAGYVRLDSDTYALILNNVREKRTEIRFVSLETPNIVSEPLEIYQFDEVQQAVLLLDEESKTWFMYYRTYENSYGVKVAPVSTP
jgi:hypothetical protein